MGDTHVMPIDDLVDHDQVRTCWCAPECKVLCDDCDGDGCWKCDNGLMLVDPGTAEDVVVVHNAADGRELKVEVW